MKKTIVMAFCDDEFVGMRPLLLIASLLNFGVASKITWLVNCINFICLLDIFKVGLEL